MKIFSSPRLVGIMGYPLGHTLSPPMHNAAFQYLGLDYVYVPFAVPPGNLADAVNGIRALHIAGCNVTIPYKEQVISFLDRLHDSAKMVGAVNTIVNRDGELWGYNTDGAGFLRSLTQELSIDIKGKSVLMLGAGGAARAVGFALAQAGVGRLLIANRSFTKGLSLAQEIARAGTVIAEAVELVPEALSGCLRSADILINTLPLGMYPQVDAMPPINEEWLNPPLIVCDLIYNPRQTRLLAKAEQRGCRVLNGEGMLVFQGAEAFRLWTGHEAPVLIMRRVLDRFL
ncbi:MAG TPA: shikimate dehydrogenase [Clostridia bacterium]|nr:shikimate dehydrogenase [Clostridia bacterium]